MKNQQPAPKPRSRRLYILWATALTILLSLGAFCWLVVVPVMNTRAVVASCSSGAVSEHQAVKSLGGTAEAGAALVAYLRLPHSLADNRETSANLLGYCDEQVIPHLARLLEDEDLRVRRRAADSLGWFGPAAKATVPELIKALDDDNALVRISAAEALGRIGPDARDAVPQLVRGLSSTLMWRVCVDALAGIGHDAMPELEAFIADPDGRTHVRQAAAEALKKIKAAGPAKK